MLFFFVGKGVEKHLRELGFGYRAKYIHETAKMLSEKSDSRWLQKLREKPYDECRQELLTLCGVGPKVSIVHVNLCIHTSFLLCVSASVLFTNLQVADCVCLMSLDKHDAIPIDTHVLQVAKKHYSIKADSKTVSDKVYQQIRKI